MKRLSRNKHLNDTLLFGSMLLSEATGGVLGYKGDIPKTDIPFMERNRLFASLQSSVLLTHKVDPKKDTSGLDELRGELNGGRETQNRAGRNGGDASIPASFSTADDDIPASERPLQ